MTIFSADVTNLIENRIITVISVGGVDHVANSEGIIEGLDDTIRDHVYTFTKTPDSTQNLPRTIDRHSYVGHTTELLSGSFNIGSTRTETITWKTTNTGRHGLYLVVGGGYSDLEPEIVEPEPEPVEPEPEPVEPEPKRFLLENCYIDTSYYSISPEQMIVQGIYNHKDYSNEQELDFIEIVANDGYTIDNLIFEMIDNDGNVFNNDSITNATDKWIMTVSDYLDNEMPYDFLNMTESDNQEIEIYHLSDKKYMGVHRTNTGAMYFIPFIVPKWGNFSAIKESDGSELLLNKGSIIKRVDTSGLGGYERVDNYHTLMFSIEGGGSEPPLETFYNTYQLSYEDLEAAKRKGVLTDDVVINTYSYPYVLSDNISESTIKIGDMDTAIVADVLLGNSQLEIFSHEMNYTYSGVDELILSIPFMSSDIYLDYEQVNNTVLKMVINYDNLTGQTTLFVYSDDTLITTDSYDIESAIPINYVGVMSGYGDSEKRLSYSDVALRFRFRDSVPLVDKTGYIEGRFDKVEGLNVSELDELNRQITYGLIL